MLHRLIQRTVSVALAAAVTVSLLGVVDQLAQRGEPQPAQWAHNTGTRA